MKLDRGKKDKKFFSLASQSITFIYRCFLSPPLLFLALLFILSTTFLCADVDKSLVQGVESTLDTLNKIYEEASNTSREVDARCVLGNESADETVALIERIKKDLKDITSKLKPLFTEAIDITRQAKLIDYYNGEFNTFYAKINVLKNQVEGASNNICKISDEITRGVAVKKGNELYKELSENKQQFSKSLEEATEIINKGSRSYQKLTAITDLIEGYFKKLDSYLSTLEQVKVFHEQFTQLYVKAQTELDKATPRIKTLEMLQNKSNFIISQAIDLLDKIKDQDSQETQDLRKKFTSYFEKLKRSVEPAQICYGNLQEKLRNSENQAKESEEMGVVLKTRLDQLNTTYLRQAQKNAAVSTKKGNAANLEMWSFKESIQQNLNEMQRCDTRALEVLRESTSLSIPNLKNKTTEEAQALLTKIGLQSKLEKGDPAPSEHLAGRVQSQTPSEGTFVISGSVVTLRIFDPYAPITIPDVNGMLIKEAGPTLTKSQLKVQEILGEPAETKEKSHRVFLQEPPAGSSAAPGDTVKLHYYGDYKFVLEVPSLVGLTREEILDRASSYKVKTIIKIGDPALSRNLVGKSYDQEPAAGTKIDPNQSVEVLTYGGYQVSVPNLVGHGIDDAVAALKELGLEAETIEGSEAPKEQSEGKVYLQDPRESVRLEDGSKVKLTFFSKRSGTETKEPKYSESTYYVVCRSFIPIPDLKDQATPRSRLGIEDVKFIDSGKPTFLEIKDGGLKKYTKDFFRSGKQLSVTLVIDGKDLTTGQRYQYDGALLLEVIKLFDSLENLVKTFPAAKNITEVDMLGLLIFTKDDGKFGSSIINDGIQLMWQGGPIEDGWPSHMKEKNLNLFKDFLVK